MSIPLRSSLLKSSAVQGGKDAPTMVAAANGKQENRTRETGRAAASPAAAQSGDLSPPLTAFGFSQALFLSHLSLAFSNHHRAPSVGSGSLSIGSGAGMRSHARGSGSPALLVSQREAPSASTSQGLSLSTRQAISRHCSSMSAITCRFTMFTEDCGYIWNRSQARRPSHIV